MWLVILAKRYYTTFLDTLQVFFQNFRKKERPNYLERLILLFSRYDFYTQRILLGRILSLVACCIWLLCRYGKEHQSLFDRC